MRIAAMQVPVCYMNLGCAQLNEMRQMVRPFQKSEEITYKSKIREIMF